MRPPTHTQKLLFNAKMWKPAAIRAWIASQPASHGFTARKIELLREDYHVRQRDPKDFVPSSFRTIAFGDVEKTGIQAVIGHLRAPGRKISGSFTASSFTKAVESAERRRFRSSGRRSR